MNVVKMERSHRAWIVVYHVVYVAFYYVVGAQWEFLVK